MATWKRVNGAPVTTERELRVYDVDNPDREGYAAISRVGRSPSLALFGGVYAVETNYDREGTPERETRTLLDAEPVFA